ncbi:MAG TPA: HIRAN domain-containing protein [Selenomonadales bacterium]|nr:HIRAN domain-containing protein [Selenomonadales bacterium]
MLKSAVMTLGNSLYKQGMDRSQALKNAWRMVKQGHFYTKIAGVTYGTRQVALGRLKRYNLEEVKAYLVREPNWVDSNAVAVMISVNGSRQYKLGYLSKETAAVWYRLVERNCLDATMVKVTGGTDKKKYGANLALCLVA